MIITRTPYRISFFGGGTDYPAWYLKHGGAVLAATIDKYCYLTVRHLPPFFEHRIRVVYSKIENCQTVDEIQHPVVREALGYLGINRGVEIHHDGDLPARSGMGSSSSFTVGLLHALYALQGKMVSKHQLALQSIEIEQGRLQETVGSQDQVSAAYGGLNSITFLQNGEINIRPIPLRKDRLAELEDNLMLFYTAIKRTAHEVASTYVPNLNDKAEELNALKDMAKEGTEIIGGDCPIDDFGALLHEAWRVKRSLGSKISNPEIDHLYDRAREAGAVGGKVTGAGGGGFMLLFVPKGKQPSVINAMEGTLHVPFKLDFSGSQLIFYEQEADYAEVETGRDKKGDRMRFRELSEILPSTDDGE